MGKNFLYKDFHAAIKVVEAWGHWKKKKGMLYIKQRKIQHLYSIPKHHHKANWLWAVWIKRWLAVLQTILSSESESRRAQDCFKARRQFMRSTTATWERANRDYLAYFVTKRQYSNTVSHCVSLGNFIQHSFTNIIHSRGSSTLHVQGEHKSTYDRVLHPTIDAQTRLQLKIFRITFFNSCIYQYGSTEDALSADDELSKWYFRTTLTVPGNSRQLKEQKGSTRNSCRDLSLSQPFQCIFIWIAK